MRLDSFPISSLVRVDHKGHSCGGFGKLKWSSSHRYSHILIYLLVYLAEERWQLGLQLFHLSLCPLPASLSLGLSVNLLPWGRKPASLIEYRTNSVRGTYTGRGSRCVQNFSSSLFSSTLSILPFLFHLLWTSSSGNKHEVSTLQRFLETVPTTM